MQPQDSHDGFDWFKVIPLFIIWVVAYLLDNASKQRVPRSPKKKNEVSGSSSPSSGDDVEKVFQEWKEAVSGEKVTKKREKKTLHKEEEARPSPALSASSQPHQISAVESRQFQSAIDQRRLESSVERQKLDSQLDDSFVFNSQLDRRNPIVDIGSQNKSQRSRQSERKAIARLGVSQRQLILAHEILQPPLSLRRKRVDEPR